MPEEMTQEDLDNLLSANKIEDNIESALGLAQPITLPKLNNEAVAHDPASIDMLYDVELEVKIELGRTMLSVDDVLRLREGSIVQLNKNAGAPVDIIINGKLVAEGEVLVLNDYFCVRVTNILSNKERAITKR